MSFDDHGDGLIYGGGYVGTWWYSDVWRVTLDETFASAAFIHDFGWNGLGPTEGFAIVGDIDHGMYWGVPGYAASGGVAGTYLLLDGQATVNAPGNNPGPLLRVAGGGSGGIVRAAPGTRSTRPRETAEVSVLTPRRGAGPR
ncbi:MAG: hypothetical protein Q8Q09_00730 [Deltaproteobacteria bacterium]|nr:hypothetical protein [Deltaproteobacteria bacterium]